MSDLSRRAFMTRTAGVVATAWAGGALAQDAAAPALTAGTMRPLGKTGLQTSLVGMGTGVKAWNGESALTRKGDEAFLRLVEYAYAKGIRYFDLADMYGSHRFMNQLLTKTIDRDKVMLLTKTTAKEGPKAAEDVERFRTEIGTDRLDVVLLHCMTAADWNTTMRPCMDALDEAKAKGLLRAHGVSCHDIGALRTAVEEPWVDVILARINPFAVMMDGSPEEIAAILRTAHENGKGVLGMKIAGEGQCADRLLESLKFVIGLGCVDAMPIGFLAMAEVDAAFENVAAAVAT